MNYDNALETLNISTEYTADELRRAYYKHSLKHHPDKNNSEDANDQFRNGKIAYEFLREHKNLPTIKEDDDLSYIAFFKRGVRYMIPELENDDEFINNTVKILLDSCKNVTLKMIEKMNKDRALHTYSYLKKYKEVFNVDDELLGEILIVINSKLSSDNIIILNPNIEDLLNDKIYKFSTDGRDYYIPLWHTEVTYDVSGNDLILQCIPELPSNIIIDNYNNLHITIEYSVQQILLEQKLIFEIGERALEIPSTALKIQGKQTHVIKSKGILLAQHNDLYDTTKRGDIYVYINLS